MAEQLPDLEPSLEEAKELAAGANVIPVRQTFVDDTETPVSAFLKLRGDGPSFLLESAEQGRLGRYSFLGFNPRAELRWSDGTFSAGGGGGATAGDPVASREENDPYGAVTAYLEAFKLAEVEGLPPFAGGAVGLFGYDLVRTVEDTLGQPNPDPVGLPDLALLVTDVLLAFDHQRHELTVIANAYTDDEGGIEVAYERAAAAIAGVR